MADSWIDWPGIAEAVLDALEAETALGERRRRSRGGKRRYGTRGSLSVDLYKAAWKDFETGEGGLIPSLIERELGCDWKARNRWLEAHGLKEPWTPARGRANGALRRRAGRGRGGSGGPGREPAVRRPGVASRGERNPAEAIDEAKRIALARAIWAATEPVVGSPVEPYLSRRGTWPARALGRHWPMVPGAVAWIDRTALERADRDRFLPGFPDNAAGAMAAAYLPVGSEFVNPAIPRECRPVAVSLDPLTADGRRPGGERWRRSPGVKRGAACSMPGNPRGRQIAIVEGECDGLAVALMARAGLNDLGDVAEVRVVGSSGNFQPDRAADMAGRPVVFLPDGPGKAGKATAAGLAAACAARLRAAGRTVRVVIRAAGDDADDPAGDLTLLVNERAMRFEEAGLVDEEQADIDGWRALLGLPEGHGDGNGEVPEAGRKSGAAHTHTEAMS